MKRNELKKMIVTVGMAAVMAGALSGCGKEEKKDSTTQATTTQAATQNDTTQVEGQGDVVDGYATVSPEEFEEETGRSAFEGTYHETIAGRGTIVIKKDSDTNYTVEISWAGSAAEMSDWVCHPTLQDGKLVYDDCVQTYTIFDENGNPTTNEEGIATPVIVYEGGKGSFSFNNDGNLVWDDQNEHVADGSVFAK